MIDQGVTTALAARNALRSTNGDDSYNSGTGVRRTERATRECTYTNFLKCQPLPFKGTEGVASLSQCRLRYVLENAYEDDDGQILSSKRDQETRNGTLGSEGLPDMIHGSVVASKPKTMQEAIEIATELMDKKIRTFAEREIASKRKFENTSRNTQNQQQQHSNKRQNIGRVYTAASGEKRQYGDLDPYALNEIITTTVHVLLSAATATKLVISPLKNNSNHGNQGGRNNAPARVYVVGRGGIDPDTNVVT
nr:hypothetical protein [Tanacetum cinerariifolium]